MTEPTDDKPKPRSPKHSPLPEPLDPDMEFMSEVNPRVERDSSEDVRIV